MARRLNREWLVLDALDRAGRPLALGELELYHGALDVRDLGGPARRALLAGLVRAGAVRTAVRVRYPDSTGGHRYYRLNGSPGRGAAS